MLIAIWNIYIRRVDRFNLDMKTVTGVGQDAVQEVRATDSAKKKSPRFTKSDHEALADIFKKIGQKELTKVSWRSNRPVVISAILYLVWKIGSLFQTKSSYLLLRSLKYVKKII